MKPIYKEQLFEKNIFVADSHETEKGVEVLFSLVAMFNIVSL